MRKTLFYIFTVIIRFAVNNRVSIRTVLILTINKVLQGKDGVSGKDAITLSITSSASPVITGSTINTTLTAHIYMGGEELSSSEISALGKIKWYRGEDAVPVGEGLTLIVNTELNGSEITFTARLESDD